MNREQLKTSKKHNLRSFKPWGRIFALLMSLMLLCGVFAVSSSAVSITDGDKPNHTIKSTAPYDTIGFYTGGESNHKIKTFSFPGYITSDNTTNYDLSWYEGIKGNLTTYTSENYREMGLIYTEETPNGLTGIINFDDLSNDANAYYFNIKIADTKEKLIGGITIGVESMQYTIDYSVITIDFNLTDGTQIPYVYDNINEGDLYNPIINNASKYQIWDCMMGTETVSPYVYIQYLLDNEIIDYNTFDALWFLLDLSTPLEITRGSPDSILNWEKLSQEETDEAIYNELKLTIDKGQFSYDGNNAYIILFGENQIRSYADMLNRGEFHFTDGNGSVLPISVRTVGKFDVLTDAINSNGQYSLEFETIEFDISSYHSTGVMPSMPNLADRFWNYFNDETNYINIREIYTYITINNISSQKINMWLDMIYDKTPAMSENWVISQIGGKTIKFNTTHVSLDDISFVEWLGETVSGFFGTEMFGGVTIGDILWFIIGLSCLFASLKYFSGG